MALSVSFASALDPSHFHCVRYIGKPPAWWSKTKRHYLFVAGDVSFTAALACTLKDAEGQLVLPVWMRQLFPADDVPADMNVVPIDSSVACGEVRLRWFAGLQPPSHLSITSIILDVLANERPFTSGSVIPFVCAGKRLLLQVHVPGDASGVVQHFDLEKGTVELEPALEVDAGSLARQLDPLLAVSTREMRVLLHELRQLSAASVLLVTGIPPMLQSALLAHLQTQLSTLRLIPIDLADFVPEEHIHVEDDMEHEREASLDIYTLTRAETVAPTLMQRVLTRFRAGRLLFLTEAPTVESSTALVQLERAAQRHDQSLCHHRFPPLDDSQRIRIVREECFSMDTATLRTAETLQDATIAQHRWTLASMTHSELVRLGQFCAYQQTRQPRSSLSDALTTYRDDICPLLGSADVSVLRGDSQSCVPFYGHGPLRDALLRLLSGPVLQTEAYRRFGLPGASGVLLHGPTGCGKTTLLLSLLSSPPLASLFTVLHVPAAAQLLSKYLGETEANIRRLFSRARSLAPVVLFIDQIEALGARRSGDDGASTSRYLSTLLNEMDGISGNEGVTVVACANDPATLDEALLRPGRLDRHFLLGLPTDADRSDMVRGMLKGCIAAEAERHVVAKTGGWSGGQLKGLLKHLQRHEAYSCDAIDAALARAYWTARNGSE